MDENHTPGPWVPNYQHVLDNNCNIVAAIKSAKWPHARAKADAQLIAASPLLLSSCQELLNMLEQLNLPAGFALERARIAIARATGAA